MKFRWLKYFFFFLLALVLVGGVYVYNSAMSRLAPRPSMLDSPTSIIGFNHIGISVIDLDKMIEFYQSATDYSVIRRYKVEDDAAANTLFGIDSISYETAVLQGPNMLLELTEFEHQLDSISKMPFYGPGMTHTCYQGPVDQPVYNKYKAAGAEILSRGEGPVEVSSYMVSYAYAYDPEGNMMELEHMPDVLIKLAIGTEWARENPMWMTQVALISPDVKRLASFYEDVLEIEPYRTGIYGPSEFMDAIVDADSVIANSAWFGMDTQGKKMEMMQFINPITTARHLPRKLTDLGYSFSFEVADIQAEYARLQKNGIHFFSTPQKMHDFWMVFAQDPDGNTFSLRQIIDPNSELSLKNM